MNKTQSAPLILVIILFIVFVISVYIYMSSQAEGGLSVTSEPSASIFLNDKLIGKTPLDIRYRQGEYSIKLIPVDSEGGASSWLGKLTISKNMQTHLNRDLASSEVHSSGEMIFVQRINSQEAQVEILTSPQAARVIFDGQEKGLAPVLLSDTGQGEHDIAVKATGFSPKTLRIQAFSGYKVVVNFHLPLSAFSNEPPFPEASQSADIEDEEKKAEDKIIEKPYVLIIDTPTGFLRVRSEGSTNASEIAQVKPDEKFPFLEEANGWYKIKISSTQEGWVSARYAEKVE